MKINHWIKLKLTVWKGVFVNDLRSLDYGQSHKAVNHVMWKILTQRIEILNMNTVLSTDQKLQIRLKWQTNVQTKT